MQQLAIQPGDTFGLLTVEHPFSLNRTFAVVRCRCGTRKDVRRTDLRRLKSCGCARRALIAKGHIRHGHNVRGHGGSPTYKSWQAMKTRCLNPAREDYPLYGGRGITVCDRWLEFAPFLKDMGERPAGMTLERIDVDGNYEPQNCKWASAEEQSVNKRNSIRVEHGNHCLTVKEASALADLRPSVIRKRLKKMPAIEALTRPAKKQLTPEIVRQMRTMNADGRSQKEIAATFRVDQSTVSRIVRHCVWTNV